MSKCVQCESVLAGGVPFCPFCGHAVAGVAAPKAKTEMVPVARPAPTPRPVPVPGNSGMEARTGRQSEPPVGLRVEPVLVSPERIHIDDLLRGGVAQSQPQSQSRSRHWLRWVSAAAVLAAVLVYMGGRLDGGKEAACNDAIDSGLALVSKGSLDGARVKLGEAKLACSARSSAKLEDLQSTIRKAVVASSACQGSVRAIQRNLDGRRLQSAGKAVAALDADDADCAGAATMAQMRKQLLRQQGAAASIVVGVRQALDDKNATAAKNGLVKLEAIDREYPELPPLQAQWQVLADAARAPAPAPVEAPPSPRSIQSEPAPVRAVQPAAVAPMDNGAAMRNEMAQSFLRDAERALADGRFDAAKTYLESARRVDPNNARLDSLSRRIRDRERQVLQTETTIK